MPMSEDELKGIDSFRRLALMTFGQGYPGFEERLARSHRMHQWLAEVQQELT